MSTRTASCSCGQLIAVTDGEPIRVSVCHCLACQRRTGSVFGAQARFPLQSVAITGRSTAFMRLGDSGKTLAFHFCPDCGSTVYYTIEGHDDSLAIPVGAFADPHFPAPARSVYGERMHPWVHLAQNIEHLA
ncbi:MAG: GFA family protein [Casimicrobiaceae bacterium]